MALTTVAKEDVAELWQEYKKDLSQKELRNRLVELYLPLVKYNGERIWSRLPDGVDLDDLISAGVFGLMDAIDAFDLTRGVKFETYCVPRIRGAMLDGEVQKAACAAGMGMAMLPCFFGDPTLPRRSEPEPGLDIWVLVHPDLRRNPRVRLFRDAMIKALKRLRPTLEGRSQDQTEQSDQ